MFNLIYLSMKERLLKLTASPLSKMWLLVVFVMTCISVSADVEWNEFQTETIYKYSTKAKTYYKYTPTEDGVFYIYYTSTQPSITEKADENGPVTGYYDTDNSWISCDLAKFSWYRASYMDVFFTSKVEASVKKGTTYYISVPDNWSSGSYCGHLEGNITELKLTEQNFESNKTFDVTDTRYGQLELKFNLGATADQWAYLKIGNYPLDADKETGKIETRSGANTGSLIFNLKDSVNSWMEKGYFKEGDEMSLTITGIHAKTDENIKYGEDGTLVLKFLAPGKAHNLVSSKMPDTFYSYWQKGDTTGIAKLIFDAEVMKGDEQTAQVSIVMGYADGAGGAYQEYLDASKIYANGDTLFIDFTDKLRTYETMGLSQQYGSLNINVYNVKMADGTNPYSAGNGHSGSYAFSYVSFEEKNNKNVKPEFTPESGETLTDNLKIYFSNKDAFTFTGVKFTYQDTADRKYQAIVTEGITSEASGKSGIEYTIPLTDAIKAGKNVRLSFVGLTSSDGLTHDDLCDGIKFNPGDELTSDLAPVKTSVTSGSTLTSFDKLVLTFGEDVTINKVAGREQVVFTDKSTGKNVGATVALDEEDAKKVVITPASELKNTHKYEITVNEATVVNKQYVETSGKYGNYMTEQSYTFSLNSNKGKLDFIADPVEGSILNEISTITCKTDASRPSSTYALAYSRNTEPWVYVKLVNEQGDSIARATIKDCTDGDGFTLTFSPAITEPGKYTVVMTDSVYYLGEGYDATPNEYQVKFDYTVIAAAKKELKLTSTPDGSADNTETFESLKSITLIADEPIYGVETPISVYDRAGRNSYTATLTMDPTNGNQAIITFDEEITEEGVYTVDIPEGVLGDKTWYDNDYMTGTCNAYTVLYYSVGEQSGESTNIVADPADKSHVDALSTIKITFTDKTEVMPGDGMVTVKKDGVQVKRIDAEGDWDNYNQVNLTYKTSESGVYTFEFPEGYITDEDGNGIAAFTLTYYVGDATGDATGINGVSADKNANVKVYTLDGKAMKSAKGLKGVYIVNGKKVVLK